MVRDCVSWCARLAAEGEASVSYLDTLVRIKDEPSIWARPDWDENYHLFNDFAYRAHIGSFWWVYG